MKRAVFWCFTVLVVRPALRGLNRLLKAHRDLAQRWNLPYGW